MKIFLHDYTGHPFPTTLSRELARRGATVVHAYFTGDPGPKGDLERRPGDAAGLSFLPLSISRPYTKTALWQRRSMDIEYGAVLARAIEAARPDVVISANNPLEAQSKAMTAAKRVNAAFVFWLQDIYSVAAAKILTRKLGLLGRAVGALYTHLERRQLQSSDRVVAITEDFRPEVLAFGVDPSRIDVIENWGVLSAADPRGKANAWADQLGLRDKFVYLYTGTLAWKHDPEVLVDLARALRPRANARVVAVCQGVGVERLESARREEGLDNLIVQPLVSLDVFTDVLSTGDVMVAMIEPDAGRFSVPSKVLNYLCSAKPILISAPPGNLARRIVDGAGAGIGIDPGDRASFLRAALDLEAGEDRRLAMGRAGRAYAERTFDVARIADRFETVFANARLSPATTPVLATGAVANSS